METDWRDGSLYKLYKGAWWPGTPDETTRALVARIEALEARITAIESEAQSQPQPT